MKQRLLLWLLGFSLFLIAGIFLVAAIGFGPVSPSSLPKQEFVIQKGDGLSLIAAKLQKQGLIKYPFFFKTYAYLAGLSGKIQAGNFQISSSMAIKEIAWSLTKGSTDKKVTIIEGLRQEQIALLLQKEGFAIDLKIWQDKIKKESLEGKLFPDTYFFPKDASAEKIIQIMQKNFQKKVVLGLENEIKASKLSLSQVVTLASIVEREAHFEADRKIVAGILLKRLQNDWPLQVDATVQYAVASSKFGGQGSKLGTTDWWPKNLTSANLKIKSPYNTYLYKGLPPGPICNPSLSAIKAVLQPQTSDYWFYLNDSAGKIHYAKTDAQQAENIRKYLK